MSQINLKVSGIAHDLNNQIMILMYALDRVVTLFPDDPDARQAVKAAQHCALLVDQLVPNQRPLPHRSSVREIVSEAAMLARPLLPAYNRLEVSCRTDCYISGPSGAIEQALVNLCINARDAMDGPGVISMEAEQSAESVILRVRDTGPGVPLELRDSIFEPLFTTKNEWGGRGFGLARVRETVLQIGGSISVEAVFPHGASFRIVLPSCPANRIT
jgi:signal transduction histidine kinase